MLDLCYIDTLAASDWDPASTPGAAFNRKVWKGFAYFYSKPQPLKPNTQVYAQYVAMLQINFILRTSLCVWAPMDTLEQHHQCACAFSKEGSAGERRGW